MENKYLSELETLIVLKDNTEEIIKTIRDSDGIDKCILSLMEQFRLSEEQAKYICSQTIHRLTTLTTNNLIRIWAKNTFQFYQELDKKENKGFYTQTPLNKITPNPDIVVMGINPGSDGTQNVDFNVHKFLKGNPMWKEHRKWKYTQRIEDFLRQGLGTEAEKVFSNDARIVYINASCFQTKQAGALGNELLCKSLPSTIGLIKILKPKLLLCLSAKKIFNIEKSIRRVYLTDDIMLGQIDDISIVGVPHPSARMNNAEREYIRNVINLALKNSHLCLNERAELIRNEIQFIPQKRYKQPSKEEVKEIYEDITNYLKLILGNPFERNDRTQRFKLNNDIAITITISEGGYIGIRHISFDSKKKYQNGDYSDIQKYTDILNQYGFNVLPKNGCWIGTKFFKRYGYDIDSTTNNILSEIKTIIDLMRE